MNTQATKNPLNETRYAATTSVAQPVVEAITKQMSSRMQEFVTQPLHITTDIIFDAFVVELTGKSNKDLVSIAARFGTEQVMQALEAARMLQREMHKMQQGSKNEKGN